MNEYVGGFFSPAPHGVTECVLVLCDEQGWGCWRRRRPFTIFDGAHPPIKKANHEIKLHVLILYVLQSITEYLELYCSD